MKQLLVAGLGVALLAGCGRGGKDKKETVAARPVTVTVATAQTRDVPRLLSSIGTVKAFATVQVRSMVRGPLAQAAIKEGDEIAAGAKIFQIDPRPYQAAVAQAQAYLARDQAQLAKAEADFRRAAELYKDKSISEAVYDQTRAAVEAAKATVAADQAALANAQLQLGYCEIRSPVAGRVGTLLVDVGNLVRDNDTVLVVVNQTRPVYVDFAVPEALLPEVRRQMAATNLPVSVTVPGLAAPVTGGQLQVINNEVDTATGTVRLRAVFANQDESLWPGQFVNVTVTLGVQRAAVTIKSSAIQVGQKGTCVYLVKPDQSVEVRLVATGDELGEETVIQAGLQPGETVVTSNHLRLAPGARIQLKTAGGPPAKGS